MRPVSLQQEIEWLKRTEKVLGLPENKLVRAHIKQKANVVLDTVLPLGGVKRVGSKR